MLTFIYMLTIAISVFVFTFLGCHAIRLVLQLSDIWDTPNERSNHDTPVPRGGGIAVLFSVISFMLITGASSQLLWAATGLAVISFLDDKEGVAIHKRLLVQIAAVTLCLLTLDGVLFQGLLPFWADRLIIGFILLAFLNLTNFMDGIDGISGAHFITLGAGFIALAASSDLLGKSYIVDGTIIIAASAGFLLLNWHPARLFLGDVGSIPLGLITGFILISIAIAGHPVAAAILPAYYIVDGGLTFLMRLLRREKVWQAHSEHGYQQAVRAGWPHDEVVRWMVGFNIILIILAVISIAMPFFTLPTLAVAYAEAFTLRTLFCTRKSVFLRRKVNRLGRKVRKATPRYAPQPQQLGTLATSTD